VKLTIALGILLGYALQFFVAIQIMLPSITNFSKLTIQNPFITELVFRTLMVLLTLVIAKLVPNLSLLLSLIGAVCGTVLALVFPPVLEFIILASEEKGISWVVIIKNSIILLISLVGFLTGGYEGLSAIIKTYSN
jgi:proton-coupled amino acid transporter